MDDTTTYPSPVDKLLTYGAAEPVTLDRWPNYLELGLGPEHIPDLIRMATDYTLRADHFDDLDYEEEDHPDFWASLHALRTLGQLHAEEAIEPLLPLFDKAINMDDEWIMEEMPDIYGMFGPTAIPALTTYIAEESHEEFARIYATDALEHIATMHPETRTEVVAALTKQLELFEENTYDINAHLISSLVELDAVEAAPLMERAFAADRVEEFLMGDWDEVQVELGLKSREELPQRRSRNLFDMFARPVATETSEDEISREIYAPSSEYIPSPYTSSKRSTTKKAKSKMAKASRKKNRKKK